jgi:monoamine oxidase
VENSTAANKTSNLLINVTFAPDLPSEIVQLAKETHTWMGESIKFAVEYETPF